LPERRKSAKIRAGSGFLWGIPVEEDAITQVWKLPIKSEREDFDDAKVDRARAFCTRDRLASVGES
jgi:hypothetical protein